MKATLHGLERMLATQIDEQELSRHSEGVTT